MKVRITKQGMTFGKEGAATWDPQAGKWEVRFGPPWGGWYTEQEFEVITG
jgi:hypothetical protein